MTTCYTIPDLDYVIRFGERMNVKFEMYGPGRWAVFTGTYFPTSRDELKKYMLIAKHEKLARKIFKKEPLLSINGLTKAIKNEISRD